MVTGSRGEGVAQQLVQPDRIIDDRVGRDTVWVRRPLHPRRSHQDRRPHPRPSGHQHVAAHAPSRVTRLQKSDMIDWSRCSSTSRQRG